MDISVFPNHSSREWVSVKRTPMPVVSPGMWTDGLHGELGKLVWGSDVQITSVHLCGSCHHSEATYKYKLCSFSPRSALSCLWSIRLIITCLTSVSWLDCEFHKKKDLWSPSLAQTRGSINSEFEYFFKNKLLKTRATLNKISVFVSISPVILQELHFKRRECGRTNIYCAHFSCIYISTVLL